MLAPVPSDTWGEEGRGVESGGSPPRTRASSPAGARGGHTDSFISSKSEHRVKPGVNKLKAGIQRDCNRDRISVSLNACHCSKWPSAAAVALIKNAGT
jgi:hypothetical protein